MVLENLKSLAAFFFLAGIVLTVVFYSKKTIAIPHNLLNAPSDIAQFCTLFNKTAGEISVITDRYIQEAKNIIEHIIAISSAERNFANTAKALDYLGTTADLSVWVNILYLLKETHPDKAIRDAASESVIIIQNFFIEHVSDNKRLFNAFKEYVDNNALHEVLNDEQRYFLKNTMEDYIHSGITLPDEKRVVVTTLKKEVAELSMTFEKNISCDTSFITANHNELIGVPEFFIASLKKNDDGLYILKTDYPTASAIMEHCSVETTRKRFFMAFGNRAYPKNDEILKQIVVKRHELATALGFPDYATLDLADQMVKTPTRADNFLKDLCGKVYKKTVADIALLTKDMGDNIVLTDDGKINPWDLAYLQTQYKKRVLAIDENSIAEYFPMENTITQLLDIYTQFLSVTFKEVTVSGLWHPEVKVIAAYKKDTGGLLGYLLLDLFPRECKYSHACHIGLVPGIHLPDGNDSIRVSVVLANFSRPTKDRPSLLNRHEVLTFFHEFGHAVHALLGVTEMGAFSGTHTKRDFVELPSQMLEEWLFDPMILHKVSNHFKTNAQLPQDIIDKIVALKRFSSGAMVTRQLFLSYYALQLFDGNDKKNPHDLWHQLAATMQPYIAHHKEVNGYASFGHLTGYGAKYYGYLWSKVFALDLFSVIKQHGLLDPVIGKRYVDLVIGKGGSKDPNELLRDFLQREPNNNAYLNDLGFDS